MAFDYPLPPFGFPSGDKPATAILHYTAPPVVGGVESVIHSQSQAFVEAGWPVAVVSGRGESAALPTGVEFVSILEMDTQHPSIIKIRSYLDKGEITDEFERTVKHLKKSLIPVLKNFDAVIIHNIFTKHFNLPLTAALYQMVEERIIRNCIAWCHDFTWNSPISKSKVYPHYPWELLKKYNPDIQYVTVSTERKIELAGLLGCEEEEVKVIYNGVDPRKVLGISQKGWDLIDRIGLVDSDLNLIMPVRITQAKNIEFAMKIVEVLKDKGIRPRLVITGPPDPHDETSMNYFLELLKLRKESGLDRQVRFVYQSGPNPSQPFIVDHTIIGDLYRICDVLLIPSHREGFGMPVMEAALAGLPVVTTPIPATLELGGEDVVIISSLQEPGSVAQQILKKVHQTPIHRFRRRTRQNYTWKAIFARDIQPLLGEKNANDI
jgi:mannosylglucosylglycerate synthase